MVSKVLFFGFFLQSSSVSYNRLHTPHFQEFSSKSQDQPTSDNESFAYSQSMAEVIVFQLDM